MSTIFKTHHSTKLRLALGTMAFLTGGIIAGCAATPTTAPTEPTAVVAEVAPVATTAAITTTAEAAPAALPARGGRGRRGGREWPVCRFLRQQKNLEGRSRFTFPLWQPRYPDNKSGPEALRPSIAAS